MGVAAESAGNGVDPDAFHAGAPGVPDLGSEPTLGQGACSIVNFGVTIGALAMAFPHLYRDAKADPSFPRLVALGGWKAYMGYVLRYAWRPHGQDDAAACRVELCALAAPGATDVAGRSTHNRARNSACAVFRDKLPMNWYECHPETHSRFSSDS